MTSSVATILESDLYLGALSRLTAEEMEGYGVVVALHNPSNPLPPLPGVGSQAIAIWDGVPIPGRRSLGWVWMWTRGLPFRCLHPVKVAPGLVLGTG